MRRWIGLSFAIVDIFGRYTTYIVISLSFYLSSQQGVPVVLFHLSSSAYFSLIAGIIIDRIYLSASLNT